MPHMCCLYTPHDKHEPDFMNPDLAVIALFSKLQQGSSYHFAAESY